MFASKNILKYISIKCGYSRGV